MQDIINLKNEMNTKLDTKALRSLKTNGSFAPWKWGRGPQTGNAWCSKHQVFHMEVGRWVSLLQVYLWESQLLDLIFTNMVRPQFTGAFQTRRASPVPIWMFSGTGQIHGAVRDLILPYTLFICSCVKYQLKGIVVVNWHQTIVKSLRTFSQIMDDSCVPVLQDHARSFCSHFFYLVEEALFSEFA